MRLLSSAFRTKPLPRTFWLVWAGSLVNRLASFVVPFLALYLTGSLGFSVEQAGFVVAVYGAGSVLAGPLGGHLADTLGRKATLVVSLLASAVLLLCLAVVRSYAALVATSFALGLAADFYRPAVNAIVADVVPVEDRPGAYGLLYWAANLGFAVSTSLAGVLAERSFTLLFVLDAATSVAFALVVAATVPETRPPRPAEAAPQAWLTPYGDGLFLAFAAAQLLVAFCFFQGASTLPLDMRAHGIAPRTYGLLMAINGVLIVVLQAPVARLVARLPAGPVLALGSLLVGVGFAVAALTGTGLPPPALYATSIAVWTVGELFVSPLMPTVVAAHAPTHLRASYQGVLQLSWGLASLLAPWSGTVLLGRHGGRAVWLVCLAAGSLAAVIHGCLAGPRERRFAARAAERGGVTAP